MQFTNTTKGPKGLNTKAGPVYVEPGEMADVDLADGELDVVKGTGWFDIGKVKAPEPVKAKAVAGGKWAVVRGRDVLVTDLADEEAANAWIADPANGLAEAE